MAVVFRHRGAGAGEKDEVVAHAKSLQSGGSEGADQTGETGGTGTPFRRPALRQRRSRSLLCGAAADSAPAPSGGRRQAMEASPPGLQADVDAAAMRQKRVDPTPFGVAPDAAAGETDVAEPARRERQPGAGTAHASRRPAQRTGATKGGRHAGGAEQAARCQPLGRQPGDVVDSAEQPCVTGDPSAGMGAAVRKQPARVPVLRLSSPWRREIRQGDTLSGSQFLLAASVERAGGDPLPAAGCTEPVEAERPWDLCCRAGPTAAGPGRPRR